MKHAIAVYAEPGLGGHRRGVAHAARATLEQQQAEAGGLTVLLANTSRMEHLNRTFLGIARPTDVLSFPGGAGDHESGERYFGDIAVCVPVALTQAARRHRMPQEEIRLLVVHGVLHLLGHDHDTPRRKRVMWQAQDQILAAIRKAKKAHDAAA